MQQALDYFLHRYRHYTQQSLKDKCRKPWITSMPSLPPSPTLRSSYLCWIYVHGCIEDFCSTALLPFKSHETSPDKMVSSYTSGIQYPLAIFRAAILPNELPIASN